MSQLLLLLEIHLSFEQWFIRQLLEGTLPDELCLTKMRQQYLALCWREEELLRKWRENVQQ